MSEEELRAELRAINENLKDVKKTLQGLPCGEMSNRVVKLETQISAPLQCRDHEDRIRVLEKKVYVFAGLISAAISIAGTGGVILIKEFLLR